MNKWNPNLLEPMMESIIYLLHHDETNEPNRFNNPLLLVLKIITEVYNPYRLVNRLKVTWKIRIKLYSLLQELQVF